MNSPLPPAVGEDCAARSYLRAGDYGQRRKDGLCIVCRKELPKRRYRYCSDACGKWFSENHDWGTARNHAWTLNFDKNHVVVKHHNSYTRKDGTLHEFDTETRHACCSRCGQPELSYGVDGWLNSRLEVDHIIPINGGIRAKTCMNHQENLRVVCHGCHLILTAEQRAAGLIGRKARVG